MAAKPYFPVFIDLSDTAVLVVGAGRIALRRVRTLLDFAGSVCVVAPEVCPELEALADAGALTLYRRAFAPEDLEGMGMVLAATNDAALNRQVAELCRTRGIPVNVGSDKTLCDFYFPGVARRGSIVAGVTASGTDHAAAKAVTAAVRALLEQEDADER